VAADRGRVVVVRTGIVLAPEGGAFPPLLRLARLGVLGPLGNGRQWVPWIHIDDQVAALQHCLETNSLAGPVNLVAPSPVRQREFAHELARAVNRPSWLPAPSFGVKMALGASASMILQGQHVTPRALLDSGFQFAHPTVDAAFQSLL
jgi:uncharacterized protein (TIGR01777 family)